MTSSKDDGMCVDRLFRRLFVMSLAYVAQTE